MQMGFDLRCWLLSERRGVDVRAWLCWKLSVLLDGVETSLFPFLHVETGIRYSFSRFKFLLLDVGWMLPSGIWPHGKGKCYLEAV